MCLSTRPTDLVNPGPRNPGRNFRLSKENHSFRLNPKPAAGRGLERAPFLPVARNRLPRSKGQGFGGGEAPLPGRGHGVGDGLIRSRKWLARLCRVTRRAVRRAPAVAGTQEEFPRRLPGVFVWQSSAGPSRPGAGEPPDGSLGIA